MKCYVISIGGTGSRVMRAMTYLMGAGVFEKGNDVEYHVMTVDSDTNCGDTTSTSSCMTDYGDLRELFGTRVLSQTEWSPLTNAANGTLDTLMGNDLPKADNNTKKLYNFMYTPKERGEENCVKDGNTLNPLAFRGGFYSHTSVGSYFMTKDIIEEDHGAWKFTDDAWTGYFNGIDAAVDRIIIICSMFGGTGASGVAPLAQAIHKVYPNIKIAGVFFEPYFTTVTTVNQNKIPVRDDIINSASFDMKSRIAIDYYANQKFCGNIGGDNGGNIGGNNGGNNGGDTVFNCMYFLGDNTKQNVNHNIDGPGQKNRPNIIELYGASAVLDFVERNLTNQKTTDICIGLKKQDDNDKDFLPKFLGNNYGIYTNMADFLAFSVFYTKVLHHILSLDVKEIKNQCKWLSTNYNTENNPDETIYSFCKGYINWVTNILRGKHWFNMKKKNLFDGEKPKGDNWSTICKYLDSDGADKNGNTIYGAAKMMRYKKYNDTRQQKKDTRNYSMEYIYNKLSNQKTSKSEKVFGDLINDIMSIIETGEIVQKNKIKEENK